MSREPLLSLQVSASYPGKPDALSEVSLAVDAGEVLGLVGQSGSGKSTLALAVLRLLAFKGGVASGTIRFERRDLLTLSEKEIRRVRGCRIGLVLQSPLSSLNPALKIGSQMAEAWRAHRGGSGEACRRAIVAALESVHLAEGESFLGRRPGQLSVGEAQRVLIAMAVLHRPALLLADEPTSALDTITQADILELFAQLNRRLGMAILYISHDLLSVATLCHRIAILREGRVVECGKSEEIFRRPTHSYTRQLIAALPQNPFASSDDAMMAAPLRGR